MAYLVAVLSVSAAYLLVWGVQGGSPNVPLYPFFTLAVLASALAGGFWPGLLALGLSLFCSLLFILQVHSLLLVGGRGAALSLVAFTIVGISVSAVVAVLRRNRQALRERNAELEAERGRWQGVVEGIAEEVWACDAQGKMSLLNLASIPAMGLEPFRDRTLEEVMAEVEILHVDGTPRPPQDSPLLRALRGEIVRGEELMRHRETGKARYRYFSAAPTRDRSGKIAGAVAIVRDITDLKHAQEALIRSEKLAAVGRLAATIAHEVNNPLAAATNALYLACSDPTLKPETREFLVLADQELGRAAHITRQTLGFSRPDTSRTAVELPKLIDEVLTVYGRKLQERGITVQRRYRCGPCRDGCQGCFIVNAGELRQVVANLLANGIDALADNGTFYVRVSRLANGSKDGPIVQLTMADNGCGIRTDDLKRVFEPFFTTKESVGTGLGLWVAQELVSKQHGRIKVRSQSGKGTVFRITFPAVPHQSGAAECKAAG